MSDLLKLQCVKSGLIHLAEQKWEFSYGLHIN